MTELDELVDGTNDVADPSKRRILKVRLRQEHVIRLHELRILQGRSIASLLEKILDDYFQREQTHHPRLNGGHRP